MNLTFADGVLIASAIWLIIAVFAMIRCILFGYNRAIEHTEEYWDAGIRHGFSIAYCNRTLLDDEFFVNLYLEADTEENENAEHDESNPCC